MGIFKRGFTSFLRPLHMKTGSFTTKKPVLQKREMLRNDQILQAKLLAIKSNLDTGAPQSYLQGHTTSKKEKMESDKNSKIFNENKILLQKLNRIASRNTNTVSGAHTFNFTQRPTS